MSESLFRFLLVRPPLAQNPETPPISLSQPTKFQRDLALAAKSSTPRDDIVKVARAYINDKTFIGTPNATPFQVKLVELSVFLDKLGAGGSLTLTEIVGAVNDVFAVTLEDLVKTDEFGITMQGLRDSIVAIKYVQDEHSRPIEALVNELRDLELIQKVTRLQKDNKKPLIGDKPFTTGVSAPSSSSPPSPNPNLFAYRKRSLQIPVEADLKSIISPLKGEGNDDEKVARHEKAAQVLIRKFTDLQTAITELISTRAIHLHGRAPVPHPGETVDANLTSFNLLARQLEFQSTLRDINVDQFKASTVRAQTGQPNPLVKQDIGGSTSALALARDLLAVPRGLSPKGPLTPSNRTDLMMRLSAGVVLSDTTKNVLKDKGISTQDMPLDLLVRGLQEEATTTISSLIQLAPNLENVSMTRIGDSFVTVRTPIPSQAASLIFGHNFGIIDSALPALPNSGRIPQTKGKASPAGVADLLVVKQQLKGYEAVDVAHIESVLQGESKTREHTTTDRTETTTLSQTETTTDDQHELGTTSRFEMSKETTETIKEDESLKAGLKVSAKYGLAVEMSASVEGAISRSKEEVNRSASKYSQDVTERTVKKLTQRTLKSLTETTTIEAVEKDTHGIDNVHGTQNVSGVYQWVNKVYEAQVFNYGLRTIFDFMIPEPATFLIEAMTKTADQASTIEKPLPFNLAPSNLNEFNYGALVLRYQATDVVPPPAHYITKTGQVTKGGGDSKTDYNHTAVITIDDGYEAIFGTITRLDNTWEDNAVIDAFIGTTSHRFVRNSGEFHYGLPLDHERGSIAWGFNTWRMANVVICVEVKCVATTRAINAWKADTHAKLLTAFKARMQEYEEKLATLKLQTGVTIQGNNPTANLATINEELKKNCISIITAQHYDLFNSISTSASTGLSQINLAEADAEGLYVRFFEQAFEWDQLMYVMYPYFWGRKSTWLPRLTYNDPDPTFNEFLKAGFCRVMVPARPGFEGAIDHFIQFGELWNGGPLPPISSPIFLPIADEIAERDQRPGTEVPQGEPWTVRVPTSLVMLRSDNKLPTWTKGADGVWTPV